MRRGCRFGVTPHWNDEAAMPSRPHRANTPRVLIVPGLHDSGPAHWQSWLQARQPGALRVQQADWATPDLARWSAGIAAAVQAAGPAPLLAVAHSFGCLALVRHLAQRIAAGAGGAPGGGIVAALLVAPADPARFGLEDHLPHQALPLPATLVMSETDPWMSPAAARRWAARWGMPVISLGDAGHVNSDAGFGPLPLAAQWVQGAQQRQARQRRPALADGREWSFAI
jgi:predicted alpha/beta hydrolase family esterase